MKETLTGKASSTSSNGETFLALPSRPVKLGALPISRALPLRECRMVGPWCFLDRFGPLSFTNGKPMYVPPHPHIGLQTVTWLLAGEVLHTDSLGSQALLKPGGINVMTAGSGIAHAEETPENNTGQLNGVQLWTALPDKVRHCEPSFIHLDRVPSIESDSVVIQLFAGTYAGQTCAASYYSDIIGLDVTIQPGSTVETDMQLEYEHAIMLLEGDCLCNDQMISDKHLIVLSTNRSRISLSTNLGCRVLVIGGLPFKEKILMWWNFVARKQEEIAEARADWEAHRRFKEVPGEHVQRLSAPSLLRLSQPNPVS